MSNNTDEEGRKIVLTLNEDDFTMAFYGDVTVEEAGIALYSALEFLVALEESAESQKYLN